MKYKLIVVFQAESDEEAHDQMDDAMISFSSIVEESRENEEGERLI